MCFRNRGPIGMLEDLSVYALDQMSAQVGLTLPDCERFSRSLGDHGSVN